MKAEIKQRYSRKFPHQALCRGRACETGHATRLSPKFIPLSSILCQKLPYPLPPHHIVWIPKYRRKILYGECRKEIGSIIRELIDKKKGCEIVEGGLCADHIHLCLRVPPKYAVSDTLGYVKGKSALMIHDRHPEWRRKVGKDKTFWARGYYVSTVGLNESIIRQYIKNQEEGSRLE